MKEEKICPDCKRPIKNHYHLNIGKVGWIPFDGKPIKILVKNDSYGCESGCEVHVFYIETDEGNEKEVYSTFSHGREEINHNIRELKEQLELPNLEVDMTEAKIEYD